MDDVDVTTDPKVPVLFGKVVRRSQESRGAGGNEEGGRMTAIGKSILPFFYFYFFNSSLLFSSHTHHRLKYWGCVVLLT